MKLSPGRYVAYCQTSFTIIARLCDFLNWYFVYCRWQSLFSANTVSFAIGTDGNLRKYKHQNVLIAYPNSKYKCRQFTEFSMGTKNKQSSAKCLVLVDKLQAYWSCSLTKLYRRLAPLQLTAARRRGATVTAASTASIGHTALPPWSFWGIFYPKRDNS